MIEPSATLKPQGTVMDAQELNLAELDRVGGGSSLDSMSDLSQLMQMRIQKYLDSYTKAFEMASNVMHRIGSASGSIVQNMK